MELLAFADYFAAIVELVLVAVVVMLFRELRAVRQRQSDHEEHCDERQRVIHNKIDRLSERIYEMDGFLRRER